MTIECAGVDALTGRLAALRFGAMIESVEGREGTRGDLYVAPGFIDLQVNGFAGVDYNNPAASLEDIARSIRALFATGVTTFLPTVITGSPDGMAASLRNMADAKQKLPEGVAIEGFHVEGPHICPDDGPRGAHPRRWVRKPDIHELRRMQEAARGFIRVVTLSPEWPEAPRYIEAAVREGVVVSIGHTNATAQQIAEAVSAGATMSTHLGNGSHSVLPRHPNYIWDQLAEDRLCAGLIADGIHLPAAFLKTAVRAKGPERRVLVTDAAPPAGAAPGRYKLGEQDVELRPDEHVVLAGTEKLAGSALRMHIGIGNLVRLAGLSLAEAVAMATVTPARAARIAGRGAGLRAGERGDVVEFRFDTASATIRIENTYVAGTRVYARG
ncbi:MAG: N-acetylglucosamine-6-phosphate deacetylase [Acidobacteriota bacterium]